MKFHHFLSKMKFHIFLKLDFKIKIKVSPFFTCFLLQNYILRVKIIKVKNYYFVRGGAKMPNIKSAVKRVNVIEKKTLRNNMIKSAYKTAVKTFEKEVEAGNKENATETFKAAVQKIDQACSKGVIKNNTASRKKSKLAKKLNTLK